MKFVSAILLSVLAAALIVALNLKIGQLPPLGRFLDPYTGFWHNAEFKGRFHDPKLQHAGLHQEVSVIYDDRMVPHIFAQNDDDLYFAQGYVTATDRLWQMDVQTRLAAGRLSEVLGNDLLTLDRFQRRMGMGYGAGQMMKEVEKHPQLKRALQAYADGVNAYLATLSPKDYPFEFKFLDYSPEEWKPVNTAYLLKMMSSTLAGGSDEFYMSNILSRFGSGITRNLFPDYPVLSDPIVPTGTPWEFTPVPLPAGGKAGLASLNRITTRQREEGIGSNNWALSGSRTASGFPILANDPHLDLTLPAIWYEMQLAAPGVNVYGVSIPGAPCVIIGFNQQAAWGVTNVGSDVLDWYRIRFKDASKKEYRYGSGWRPVRERIETIGVRGAGTVYDTVRYTHHGPIVFDGDRLPKTFKDFKTYVPEGYAVRWIAHERSADIQAFHLLNRAKNYTDYRNALKWFSAPAQNFVFADVNNDIALTSNGKFPLRRKEQGKFLLDGADPANDWQGFIPNAHNPAVKNPSRGFVSSANQFPTDPTYPYYLNWEFASYDRGHRINERLGAMQGATVDSIRHLQTDTYSILAGNILPTLIAALDPGRLSDTERQAFAQVKSWNKHFDAQSIGASIFETWQLRLKALTWDEFADEKYVMRYPNQDRFIQLLLNEPQSRWFDRLATPAKKETRDDLIREAFQAAVQRLTEERGAPGKSWAWNSVKNTRIPHLGKFPGLSSKLLPIGGQKLTVNAISQKNGPSWRMVVALGHPTKGYGVFPGGESGNPGSFYYDNMINTWAAGQLNELLFLTSPTEQNPHIRTRITLTRN